MTQLASARKAGVAGLKPPLHEFCLPTAPMLPVPVVRCVIALERKYKGLEQEGLYRISGNKAKVSLFSIILIVNIHLLVKASAWRFMQIVFQFVLYWNAIGNVYYRQLECSRICVT